MTPKRRPPSSKMDTINNLQFVLPAIFLSLNTHIHIDVYTFKLLYKKQNSCLATLPFHGVVDTSPCRRIDALLPSYQLCNLIAYFTYPSTARQLGYFQRLSQAVLSATIHACSYICASLESRKPEYRILACALEAFSMLSQASQLPLLIAAQPPFEPNLANLHRSR